MNIRKIAISTGGGDAPGLNAVIRAVTLSALKRRWEVVGIADGYNGLLFPEQYDGDALIPLDRNAVRGISHLGGTIIGTTNRGNPFEYSETLPDGSTRVTNISDRLVSGFARHNIDALVAVGGDGSMAIANQIAALGIAVVGVPKTIDNDLDGTVETFGFDTAVTFATECLGRLHSTAASHDRVMVVEVMGRHAGWIALHAGIAGSADVILIPEIPFDIQQVAAKIRERNSIKRNFSIVVVAEGAMPIGGQAAYQIKGEVQRLGGIGRMVADQLRLLVPNEVRDVVLGHLLRGGTPTAADRLLSLRFGAAAVRALEEGATNVMVALDPPTVRYIPLEQCTRRTKVVPLDCDTLMTARDLGIELGD